jgi:IS605 OrfB family transposase
MKLTLQIQLLPDKDQDAKLQATVRRFNEAASWLSKKAFEHRTANKVALQKLFYVELRALFGLSAQMAIRCIAQVVEAYKRDKTRCPTFRPFAAMPYDQRIVSFKGLDRVSLLTLAGRIIVPMVMGRYQRERFTPAVGQSDLVRRKDGKWFLLTVVDVPDGTPVPTTDFIGVDLGLTNIATDSTGEPFSGGTIKGLRHRHARLRARLQSKGTKSARRLLKKRRRKESLFARDVNHCVSKKLVAKAQGTNRGIALEDLKGIRSRMTVKKPQRRIQHSWAFAQLRLFIEYKAKLAGVPVVLVNPRNTSRTCPCCSCVHKANRPTQSLFFCIRCGFSGHADTIAAENIRRAAVNRPCVAAAD